MACQRRAIVPRHEAKDEVKFHPKAEVEYADWVGREYVEPEPMASWDGKGKYMDHVPKPPVSGQFPLRRTVEKHGKDAYEHEREVLNALRLASSAYYELWNNGGCNLTGHGRREELQTVASVIKTLRLREAFPHEVPDDMMAAFRDIGYDVYYHEEACREYNEECCVDYDALEEEYGDDLGGYKQALEQEERRFEENYPELSILYNKIDNVERPQAYKLKVARDQQIAFECVINLLHAAAYGEIV